LPSQVENLRASIARHFPAGCSVTRPQGGYALWVQLPEGCDGLALYEAAKEKGINIVPGTVFSTEDRYRGCVRLNAGNPWSEELDWAAQLLGTLIGT
jgi:DNA-binding transcriptional MocR family regulator